MKIRVTPKKCDQSLRTVAMNSGKWLQNRKISSDMPKMFHFEANEWQKSEFRIFVQIRADSRKIEFRLLHKAPLNGLLRKKCKPRAPIIFLF